LRAAIMEANAHPNTPGFPDEIHFNLPASGVQTITPASPLPVITDPVVIDGTTQPGFAGYPLVMLNGNMAGAAHGLEITAGNSTVKGMIISGFSASGRVGILLETGGGNLITGNYIGTDASGTARLSNEFGLLIDQSANNTIGGTNPAVRNIISGNTVGVVLEDTSANLVAGNFIGTDAFGTRALGNARDGVQIVSLPGHVATGNMIGGTSSGARNIISGNNGLGIAIFGDGTAANLVQGNFIGTDATGTIALANNGGILISSGFTIDGGTHLGPASSITVGGTSAGAGNLISGNGFDGVQIGFGARSNLLQGNFIGTRADGLTPLGNSLHGVEIFGDSPNNIIGGTAAGARNVISGNGGNGVFIDIDFGASATGGNQVLGNFIGTDLMDTANLGNTGNGVLISNVPNNTIGDVVTGAGNVIARNAGNGVNVTGASARGNPIRGNSIHDNRGIGINLVGNDRSDGTAAAQVTPNHPPATSVSGPNDLMNFPVGVTAYYDAPTNFTVISGLLDTADPFGATVDIYLNRTIHPSGFGEGQRYLTSVGRLTTNPLTADGTFRVFVPGRLPAGFPFVSATATDSNGSTSEFGPVCTGDTAGDGLCDEWKTRGIDFTGRGIPDLLLPGASPMHKDLYVEIDYMPDVANATPDPLALQDVETAFAAAPVNNPDGSTGIHLHTLIDNAISAADEAASNPIIFSPTLPIQPGVVPGATTFDDLKRRYFGTAAERSDPNAHNILGAKRLAYHYAIFGNNHAHFVGSSGIAERPGNDFMVTLGGWSAAGIAFAGGLRAAQAGTFMHEFGHTLGLHHGGPGDINGGGDDTNCKPNYLSVMSYSLQFPTYDGARPLDYSRQALVTLNESSLNEPAGVGGPAGRNVVYGVGGLSTLGPTNGPIDWNGNGDSTEVGIAADINFIANAGCPANPGEMLTGGSDWNNLIFNFRASRDFANGSHLTTDPHPDLTADQVQAMAQSVRYRDLAVSLAAAPNPVLYGSNLTYTAIITNNGPQAATGVTLTDSLPAGVTFVSATSSQGNCMQTAGTVTCNLGTMAWSATARVTIVVTPGVAGPITNTVSVAGNEPDPIQANNSATRIVTVNPIADIAVTVAGTPDPIPAGTNLTYTATVRNNGPFTATGVILSSGLPVDVMFVSITSSQGSCTWTPFHRVITCSLGTLANGSTATVTLIATSGALGPITSAFSLRANEADPNPTNNVANAQNTGMGSATFARGDIFLAGDPGLVQWRRADGSFYAMLHTPFVNFETDGMAFDSGSNFYASAGQIIRFDNRGIRLGTFGSGYSGAPFSILFDAAGNAYVGGTFTDGMDVRKFDAAGNPLAQFGVAIQGTRFGHFVRSIDLAADQRTLFYTSNGHGIQRYDVVSNTQLPDFATGLPGSQVFTIRLLPDDGLLVANRDNILRLDSSGNIVRTYGAPGYNGFEAVALDPDGRSFWSDGCLTIMCSPTVFKFDIASGAVLQTFAAYDGILGGGIAMAVFNPPTATTTRVSSSASPSVYGQLVTFTIRVSAVSGSGTPTGTVTFTEGALTLGTATLSSGSATFSIATLAAGSHTITAVYGGDGTFPPSSSPALSQTVNQAALTVMANNATKVYGQANPAFIVSYSGFVLREGPGNLSGTLSFSTPATTGSHVGNYAITPSGLTSGNYAITFVNGTLSVTPAPLTITADSKTKAYGAPLPALTASYSGFVNGDSAASLTTQPTLSTTATAASHVAGNPYSITASGAVDSDYTISYVAGTLTVTPVALTITADNKTKAYGAALPALTASYAGFINGDSAASLTTQPTLTTTATASSHVAGNPYSITASGAVDSDYAISYVVGTLTVTPVALTITTDNKTVQYSDPAPAFTVTYSGFVPGDGPSVLSGSLSGSTTRTLLSNVGTYPITCSGQTSSDYTITYVAGALTVIPEDARIIYSGTTFAITALSTSTATVTLSATVMDITAVPSDPAYDTYPGNISTATVTFVNRDTGAVLAANVPVGLVSPGDPTVGTATANVTLDIGSQDSQDYTIGMIVGGNYTRNSGVDNSVLTVSKNLPGFITGGGYLLASASAGAYSADPGTNINFGFNVRYNPSQSHLQGHANVIVRKTVDGVMHVYQIKTTAILSMGFGPASNQAQYTARAVIQDITDPNNVISIAGNQTFQMTMTDNGAGSSDTIGFTLWNPAGGLQLSSNWSASLGRTVEQPLAGGSLVVHSDNQIVAGGPGHNLGIKSLTVEQLQPIWTEALARWAKAGATPAQVSPLAQVTVQIVSLPPGILARTGPDTIWISRDAAGYGWFIDPTPSDNGEFNGRPASAAQNRMDLLTVVAHEMGHLVLQMEESAEPNDVMTEALPVGVRRMPTPHDLGLADNRQVPAIGLTIGSSLPNQMSASPVGVDILRYLAAQSGPSDALLVRQAQAGDAGLVRDATCFLSVLVSALPEAHLLPSQTPSLQATEGAIGWTVLPQRIHRQTALTATLDTLFADWASSPAPEALCGELAVAGIG
jgi:uncharacterized repeat protein (TIGR01451 family)